MTSHLTTQLNAKTPLYLLVFFTSQLNNKINETTESGKIIKNTPVLSVFRGTSDEPGAY